MAVIRRFFATSGAGFADGTTWGNRAPLLTAGVVSTIVTGFNFTSDQLEVVVDPGTYNPTAAPVFTGAAVPSRSFPCSYIAGDGAGGLWVPPNLNWRSAEPAWSNSGMPHLNVSTANISFFGQTGVTVSGFEYTSVNTTTRVLNGLISFDWGIINHNGSNVSAFIYDSAAIMVTNSVLRMNGTAYSAALTGVTSSILVSNVRIEGNPSASSGNRNGWATGANAIFRGNRVTIIGHVGNGINQSGTGAAGSIGLESCVIYGNGGDGVISNGTATAGSRINSSLIVNNTGTGVNITNTAQMSVTGSRLRNNSVNFASVSVDQYNEIGTGTDSDEFVNVSGAVSTWDLRIKNTSAIWGKGYGAGDQPAAGGGSSTHNPFFNRVFGA